jgi:putative methionine-R-sulfoxide reductase with GAF domain
VAPDPWDRLAAARGPPAGRAAGGRGAVSLPVTVCGLTAAAARTAAYSLARGHRDWAACCALADSELLVQVGSEGLLVTVLVTEHSSWGSSGIVDRPGPGTCLTDPEL